MKVLCLNDYHMYKFSIKTDKKPISISWSNEKDLMKWHALQHSFYGRQPKHYVESFKQNFAGISAHKFQQSFEMGAFDLPPSSKIIDVGSGVAVIDLILYNYIDQSSFWLIDQNDIIFSNEESKMRLTLSDNDFNSDKFIEVSQKMVDEQGLENFYSQMILMTTEHPFYNSWSPTIDAIKTSGFDHTRFNFISPTDDIVDDVDLIMSFYSWCWHYDKSTYWNKLIPRLKKKGKLLLDILTNSYDDILQIDNELKCNSEKRIHLKARDGRIGYRCLWTKNV